MRYEYLRNFGALFFVIMLISGCGQDDNTARQGNTNEPNTMMVQDRNNTNDARMTNNEVSDHLANLAASVPNVHQATAIVLGNYAIVGIDVDANMERSDVGSVKYAVAESLKDDPYGAFAVVVADADSHARLQEVREDIDNGRPLTGILNELADITGRIIPEVPADLVDEDNNDGLEKQKEKLDSNEEKQLESEQDEQSNHHK